MELVSSARRLGARRCKKAQKPNRRTDFRIWNRIPGTGNRTFIAGNVCRAQRLVIFCDTEMQSLMHQVQSVFGGNVGLLLGYVLLALMAGYAAALCFGTFRRLSFEREQQSLTRERLK